MLLFIVHCSSFPRMNPIKLNILHSIFINHFIRFTDCLILIMYLHEQIIDLYVLVTLLLLFISTFLLSSVVFDVRYSVFNKIYPKLSKHHSKTWGIFIETFIPLIIIICQWKRTYAFEMLALLKISLLFIFEHVSSQQCLTIYYYLRINYYLLINHSVESSRILYIDDVT